jgi:hypothetical protein
VDGSVKESKQWTLKAVPDLFISPRRNSRMPKILAHQYADADYSLWIDGNITLKVPMQHLIDEWMLPDDWDMAIFKHHARDCIYDEAMICATNHLDDPEKIINQVRGYEIKEFAKHKGMAECGVILRKHSPKMEAFNNAWWSEYGRHAHRDQLSFPIAVEKTGLRVHYITPSVYQHPYFEIDGHLTARTTK